MYIDYPEGPDGDVRTTFWLDHNTFICLERYDSSRKLYGVTACRGGLEDSNLFVGTYESCKKVYDGLVAGLRLNATLCSITTDGEVRKEILTVSR